MAAFVDLEDETDENAGGEDVAEEEDNTNKIDLSVEVSNAAIVQEVALEADEQEDMPILTHAEVNLTVHLCYALQLRQI
jgi:hypothetical protein